MNQAKSSYQVNEAAALLTLTRRSIYRMIKDGRLQAVKKNGALRIPAIEITQYLGKAYDKLLPVNDVAARLSVSRCTIYRWFHEGKLPGIIIGNHSVRIFESGVKQLNLA